MDSKMTEKDFETYIASLPIWAQDVIEEMAIDNANDTSVERGESETNWAVAINTAAMIWDDPASFGLSLKF